MYWVHKNSSFGKEQFCLEHPHILSHTLFDRISAWPTFTPAEGHSEAGGAVEAGQSAAQRPREARRKGDLVLQQHVAARPTRRPVAAASALPVTQLTTVMNPSRKLITVCTSIRKEN
jgi:hypothetical protein